MRSTVNNSNISNSDDGENPNIILSGGHYFTRISNV